MQRIVVDWGTSNLRAYRFGADGAVAETRQAAAGILTVSDRAFEAVLRREIGDWMAPGGEIFLSGMITSRNGWIETPYVETPATLRALADGAVERRLEDGVRLRFLPGVCQRSPTPDVMRGEEIQVFGAIEPGATGTLVHPGTHGKWVRVEKGAIVGFRSFMTGEVFAVLKKHSILGRLIPEASQPFNERAFTAGVRHAASAESAGFLNDIFTTRSGVLLGAFPPEEIEDRLSGLIIGREVASGLAFGWTDEPPLLFGDDALCARYALAFAILGHPVRRGGEDATVEGFRRLNALPPSG
jgi:2-dehydro-3-deoxygalactonokinase